MHRLAFRDSISTTPAAPPARWPAPPWTGARPTQHASASAWPGNIPTRQPASAKAPLPSTPALAGSVSAARRLPPMSIASAASTAPTSAEHPPQPQHRARLRQLPLRAGGGPGERSRRSQRRPQPRLPAATNPHPRGDRRSNAPPFNETNLTDRNYRYGTYLPQQMTRHLRWRVDLGRNERHADDGAESYDENSIYLRLVYTH